MFLHKLLLLPHLLVKQMKGKEPLVDYKMSHVVNFEKYAIKINGQGNNK
jgi:hypothetical protein